MSSDVHKLEMASSTANDGMRGLAMQHYRVATELPEDERFFAHAGFRREVDLQLFLVLLIRLRRAVGLGAHLLDEGGLDAAIEDFDGRIPPARQMRNVSEHVDDYLDETGRKQTEIEENALGVRIWGESSETGMRFAWAGMEVDLDELLEWAEALYFAFRKAVSRVATSQ